MFVGTSGWTYEEWRGVLYPEDLPSGQRLAHYASRFPAVELNSTFYGLPRPETVDAWAEQVPDSFRFAVKASRYLTHLKHLKDPEEPLDNLLERTLRLGDRHGPLLVQLPGQWRPDPERLGAFLAACPGDIEVAVEFRDPRWYVDPVREVLERHGAATVWHDFPDVPCPEWETAPFLYLRRHGSSGEPYRGRYGRDRLAPLAERLRGWPGEVHCYFNNDVGGDAPRDAAQLLELLDEEPP